MPVHAIRVMLIAVPVLACCACDSQAQSKIRDRYRLAAQSDVYVIHHIPRKTFSIEQKGDRGAGVALGGVGVGLAVMTSNFESARLQQKLDLEDPAIHVKAAIVEELRSQFDLTNLRVFPEASHLTVLPLSKFERLIAEAEEGRSSMPGEQVPSGRNVAPAAKAPTFNEQYSSGVVLEVVTDHWGMDDYRIKYTASLRLVDLQGTKVMAAARCRWVILDPIDSKKLFFEAGAGGADAYGQMRAYAERAERLLYAENGALLKATLRQAAEQCADEIIVRLFPRSRQ